MVLNRVSLQVGRRHERSLGTRGTEHTELEWWLDFPWVPWIPWLSQVEWKGLRAEGKVTSGLPGCETTGTALQPLGRVVRLGTTTTTHE